ncbi:MAG: HAD-IA family hydrolase [Myxococcota bacterium]|nr:HAD-IA family hydrolase [Myxococcota bacterium]
MDPNLVENVDLLCLDAGNTIVFLDHDRLARACARVGVATTAAALLRAEGAAKLAAERGPLQDFVWSCADVRSAAGWARTVGCIFQCAGVPGERVPQLLDALWPDHCEQNFWCRVPAGLAGALDHARARGVLVAVISNSEGMLEQLFDRLGILRSFDAVIDSGIVGVEKPDPRIFQFALDRFRVGPDRALHLGDMYATDVLGARAAGMRVALIDPYRHMDGRHLSVPRVAGVAEVAEAVAQRRG